MGRTPALTVAWASVVCLLAFANGCRRLEDDEAGVCLEVLKISGVELEDGQDESSLQTITASYISPEKVDTYVTMRTSASGEGEFEFYFSPPSLLNEEPTPATSIAVEFLALMPAGFSGSSWLVDIYKRANDTGWESIGDFSAAIPSWSPVSLTISGPKLTDYIDYEESSDILVRVYTDTEDTEQLGYIDFAQITASAGAVPTPQPGPAVPVAGPIGYAPAPVSCFSQQPPVSDDDDVAAQAEGEDAEVEPSSAPNVVSGGLFAAVAAAALAATFGSVPLKL